LEAEVQGKRDRKIEIVRIFLPFLMIIALQENKAPLFSHFPSPAAEYYISLSMRCIIEKTNRNREYFRKFCSL
jgi:hypothetical protein